MSSGARLFTALLPPSRVVAELDALLGPRRPHGPWRWTRPEGWHVTLAFMESVEAEAVHRLCDLLAEVAEHAEPFPLVLRGARCFPSVERARLLAMNVEESPALDHLAQRCRNASSRAGARPDGARFVAHLTLGRVSRPVEATRWVQLLDSFPSWQWEASELVLVQSHLHAPARRYEVRERFPLGAGGHQPGAEEGI